MKRITYTLTILACAAHLFLGRHAAAATQKDIAGPPGSGTFGNSVTVLPNGNIVVTDPYYDAPGPIADVGAVHLYNAAGTLLNTLTGSTANDQVGVGGITVLANGNYLVRTPVCKNGAAAKAGALTWCSGTTGCGGTVSAANSLVGTSADDQIGALNVTELSNGHYVVRSPGWDNGAVTNAGAVTWCNGTTGRSGTISSENSLVGSTAEDEVGSVLVRALSNGNYVVSSPNWNNGGTIDAGASTWCDGSAGCSGPVTTANSLIGAQADDRVGFSSAIALTNGHYVVRSRYWSNGASTAVGAATWCNGAIGCTGTVSTANSLVGKKKDDEVGERVVPLANGHYVVTSTYWDNGAATDAGAVTWCDGAVGCTGEVSSLNSLVGSASDDRVGNPNVAALTNGNYVVNSADWNSGTTSKVGAATWCSGTGGCTGAVSSANSLVGSTAGDRVGRGTTALTNGHYVVQSSDWDSGGVIDAGAATWCDGTKGCKGPVSTSNSLVGETVADFVGSEVEALANGNYVVGSPNWDHGPSVGAGAATWCDGAVGCTGAVSAANSLIGGVQDVVGRSGIYALSNGNYVVNSDLWGGSDFGAVTWCSGTGGCTGTISATNSLVGSSASDLVGLGLPLSDGNYAVHSVSWDNGAIANVGATTLGRGDIGTVGVINAGNSVRGGVAGAGSGLSSGYNPDLGQLVVGRRNENILSLFTYRGPDITVTTTADHNDGNCSETDCSLREAIEAANASPDDSIIAFASGVTGAIQLTAPLPDLRTNITLQGPGADVLTVRRDTGGEYRIFFISNGTDNGPIVNVHGLTISNGETPAGQGSSGGGILNRRATLTVSDCVLTGNRTAPSDDDMLGGAIFNSDGNLTIEDSTITGNAANNGGGVASARTIPGTSSITIRNSTLRDNSALRGSGGGIYSSATDAGRNAKLYLNNCTLSGNSATPKGFFGGSGGAIYNLGHTSGDARVFLQDCTVSGNNAPSAGGIYNHSFSATAVMTLRSNILKKGNSGSNFINADGVITSLGGNLSDDDASSGSGGTGPGGFLSTAGDIRNTDPLLGPLQDNGGRTFTHALLPGSAAINAGVNTGESLLDQRGFPRVEANDIGAFEFGAVAPPPTPTPTPTPGATPQPSATPDPTATPIPTATPTRNRFANISTRLRVETGDNVLIGGFIVTGASQKRIIIRALGPSLPVEGALPNPVLELYDSDGEFVASNDNWQEAVNGQEIIDSTIPPSNDLESAILRDVAPGAYTAVVRDAADGAGVGLIEVYDLGSDQDAKLANISTRGHVLTGDSVMIGGLILTGSSPQKVIIRAIGPSLPIDGKLEDPLLELFDGSGTLLSSNNNWKDAQQSEIEATTIPPSSDLESAIVTSLPPAAYTAVVRGVNDTTGVALVEAYALE